METLSEKISGPQITLIQTTHLTHNFRDTYTQNSHRIHDSILIKNCTEYGLYKTHRNNLTYRKVLTLSTLPIVYSLYNQDRTQFLSKKFDISGSVYSILTEQSRRTQYPCLMSVKGRTVSLFSKISVWW